MRAPNDAPTGRIHRAARYQRDGCRADTRSLASRAPGPRVCACKDRSALARPEAKNTDLQPVPANVPALENLLIACSTSARLGLVIALKPVKAMRRREIASVVAQRCACLSRRRLVRPSADSSSLSLIPANRRRTSRGRTRAVDGMLDRGATWAWSTSGDRLRDDTRFLDQNIRLARRSKTQFDLVTGSEVPPECPVCRVIDDG